MSQENVEVVRQGWEAWMAGDLAGMLELVDDDVVIDASRRTLDARTFVGHQGVRDYFAMMADTWSAVSAEPEDFIAAGNSVVIPVRIVNTGRVSSLAVEARAAWVAEVRDGRVTRWTVYQSRAEALEAVGLSE